MRTLKQMVENKRIVKLVKFKHNLLWYSTECGFEFPVSVTDIKGEAELLPEETAMSMMKWIKKQIDFIQNAKDSQQS